jgi:uncharacterized OB-fold protein
LTATRFISDILFNGSVAQPRLVGSRCEECATVTFPRGGRCPRCGCGEMQDLELSPRGTLWTFTTQEFELKEPYRPSRHDGAFEPFALGYVELPERVKVESWLTEQDPRRLEIGMEMELVLIPAYRDPDGTEVLTYAFAPSPPKEE